MRCAVLGDPIAHSLSPVLHRAGLRRAGLDWEYDAVRVAEDELAGFLGGLDARWRGLSLTMPLKRRALGLARSVTPRAALAGAANTLLLEDGVVVLADNTDLPGAAAAVRERYDGPVTAATVLGGGATAASTGLALCDLGARTVRRAGAQPRAGGRRRGRDRRAPVGTRGDRRRAGRRPDRGRDRRVHGARRGPGRRAGRPLRRRTGRVRGPLRPVADPAGHRGGRPGAGRRAGPAGAPGGAAVRAVHRSARTAGRHARGRRGGPGERRKATG